MVVGSSTCEGRFGGRGEAGEEAGEEEKEKEERTLYFKHVFLLLFLHNSHGTTEIPDCGNLVRPD